MFVNSVKHPAGKELTLHIKMTELAERLDVSRLNLSKMLNQLARNGEIDIKREQITIHG
jgi:Mn-dependent DtxR family transcriptional regulator